MSLSEDAKSLLIAAHKASGWIRVTKATGPDGYWFYVRVKTPSEPAFAEGRSGSDEENHWDSVIHELFQSGLIHPSNTKRGITTYTLANRAIHMAGAYSHSPE